LETLTPKMKARKKPNEVLYRILSAYPRRWTPNSGDPFKALVRTILSQNTNWRNEDKAYRCLEEQIGVTPNTISAASLLDIAEAIHPAGMYNQRSIIIKEVAKKVLALYDGDLTQVLSKPYPVAREELMKLPGVGKKTADVVLLFNAGKLVLPVDRHIARISKRLGLVPSNADYETIRLALEGRVAPESYLDAHIKLIQFGRDICRALNPKCSICPISDPCPYHTEAGRNPKSPNETESSPKRRKRAK
jgi:endonuclease-3